MNIVWYMCHFNSISVESRILHLQAHLVYVTNIAFRQYNRYIILLFVRCSLFGGARVCVPEQRYPKSLLYVSTSFFLLLILCIPFCILTSCSTDNNKMTMAYHQNVCCITKRRRIHVLVLKRVCVCTLSIYTIYLLCNTKMCLRDLYAVVY